MAQTFRTATAIKKASIPQRRKIVSLRWRRRDFSAVCPNTIPTACNVKCPQCRTRMVEVLAPLTAAVLCSYLYDSSLRRVISRTRYLVCCWYYRIRYLVVCTSITRTGQCWIFVNSCTRVPGTWYKIGCGLMQRTLSYVQKSSLRVVYSGIPTPIDGQSFMVFTRVTAVLSSVPLQFERAGAVGLAV